MVYLGIRVAIAYLKSGKGRVCTWDLINTLASMAQRAGENDLRIISRNPDLGDDLSNTKWSSMLDQFENQKIKIGSERGFGLVFFCFFLIVATLPLLSRETPRLWALAVAFIFVVLALARPAVLAPLNKIWFKFGLLLGKIISPVVMSLVFFLTVLPTGIIMRLLGKDLLNRKIDRSAPSYWVKREDPVGSMRNQF